MREYTNEELTEISIKCIDNIKAVLENYSMSIGYADHIIDNLIATFVGHSMVQIPIDKQIDYLKDRLMELSKKLGVVYEEIHKLTCNNCNNHELHSSENRPTIH